MNNQWKGIRYGVKKNLAKESAGFGRIHWKCTSFCVKKEDLPILLSLKFSAQ